MANTIVGLYDDTTTAHKVIDLLEDEGVDRNNVYVKEHSREGRSSSDDDNLIDGLTRRNVPEDDARFYAEGVRRGGTLVLLDVEDKHLDTVSDVMNEHKPVPVDRRRERWEEEDDYSGYDPNAEPYSEDEVRQERERYADEEESVPMVEEDVSIGKRSVQRGGVRIHSRVVEDQVEEDVTVRDEEVDVEEHATDRDLSAEEADAAFQEQDVEMSETEEEVVVDKKARQTGEVTATKTATDRTEHVSETERRTEVDVEDSGDGERRRKEEQRHE